MVILEGPGVLSMYYAGLRLGPRPSEIYQAECPEVLADASEVEDQHPERGLLWCCAGSCGFVCQNGFSCVSSVCTNTNAGK